MHATGEARKRMKLSGTAVFGGPAILKERFFGNRESFAATGKNLYNAALNNAFDEEIMKKALFFWALLIGMTALPNVAVLADTAPVLDPSFKIIAGDVLHINVWKEAELDQDVLVLPDGNISFPLIGTVKLQGGTLEEAQVLVKTKLQEFVPDATVTITVKSPSGHVVNVIGQVNKPGELLISRHMTTLQALSQAGGLTPYASKNDIIIIRHGADRDISLPVPYDDIVSDNELEKDLVLEPGDVIVVPTATLF